MRVLCAIPALDEEVAIGSMVLRARAHADEVLVVDDGSADRTADVARLAGATVIRHESNHGKGEAYRTYWDYARKNGFDVLVTLDGDGQHDAGEIPLLLDRIRAGDDFVIGARWGSTTEMPWWRKVGKRVLDYGTAAASEGGGGMSAMADSGPKLTDSQSGFRAYSRKALEAIEPHQSGFSVESQLLIEAHQAGLRIGETRIHCRYDVEGSTLGSFTHASGVLNDLLFQVGVRHPLLYLSLPGLVMVLGGIAAGLWTAYLFASSGYFSVGWILVSLFLTTVGVLAFFVGLLFNLLPRSLAHALRRLLPRAG
ncbi:MAG: glycosyltransferase family 2 protein [Thermoplasmatota archaeon]